MSRMRIVLCEEDALMRDMLESLVASTGHEVAGVADTTASAVSLLEAARPDAVVLDVSLGFNTDFDVIETAIQIGALAVVFSKHLDLELFRHYTVQPVLVPKPDLAALEQVLRRLGRDEQDHVVENERRKRPERAAAGPEPTGIEDAQAFFEAINDAQAGDAMVSIDVAIAPDEEAADILPLMRGTDRLLVFPSAVRLYLPGGGMEGVRSLLARISGAGAVDPGSRAVAIVVEEGEQGADAFDRLKRDGAVQELGAASPDPAL